ncbi:microcin C transport system substrate-binding protein [Roseovarius azorensis]|uniref:Microcin C transport system substrate-binding protein n=2 Tax=Roseovarius azorensis TaxID=1287727 RepID=A0A1H7RLT1_9RHOB|nr:extracellular solute-binding protein [Roseovarius azorensis]SEL60774.1 microcin C transport system substrate-binding protein [Roseovarius azorensis]
MTGHQCPADARVAWKVAPWRALMALAGLSIAALMAQAVWAGEKIITSHGYSFYGDLKYPADYEHFDYVNPDAPKGGEIALYAPGTFDSMNPYSRKGRAGRLSWMVYESLLGGSEATGEPLPGDRYNEGYGLLAERLEYDEGKTWVIFHMRPEARFADGTPVTAHDVVFSHDLFLEQGLKSYADAVKRRVLSAEALDDHRVKFTFAEGISRRSLIDQVGGTPVFPRKWYEDTGARLDEPRLEAAPGSGPYQVKSYDVNRNIVYERNPDYWGWHLPINKGRHNFDRIRIEYFADDNAAFEAFKAGIYTFRPEGNSKTWATGYDFPAMQKGHVVKAELPDGLPPTPSGFVFNLGREKLQDKRVRQAIALGFNFEWTNASLQYGLFRQRHSFVQDTPLEAKGVPEGAELELLKSLGDLVPEEMLTAPAVMAHESDGSRLNDRRNLRAAMKLLDEAGWAVGGDGKRRNAAGEVLRIEIPISASGSATMSAVVESFVSNLQLMGIDAKFDKIDAAQYTARERDRDYDMIFDSYVAFLEAGTGLHQRYGSKEAAFSLFNPAGLASPMVDAIIDRALESGSKEEQDVALTALDRALRYEFFMVPTWYLDQSWVAYWDMFDYPRPLPPYATGVLDFWWYDAEKAEALKAAGAL